MSISHRDPTGSLLLRVAAPGAPPFEHSFSGQELVVGRGKDADLVIADRYLSRHHARLRRSDDSWVFEDLESHNGSRLNGRTVSGRSPVAPGDVIELSSTTLTILDPQGPSPGTGSPISPLSTEGFFRHASDMLEGAGKTAESVAVAGQKSLLRYAEHLEILNQVHRALDLSEDLDDLLQLILTKVFDHLQPDHGVILLRTEDGSFRRAASRPVDQRPVDNPISRTLIREVAEKGMAAVVLDASTDERFGEAQSIVDMGVRSLVAAPLLGSPGSKSLGMIALGSLAHQRRFTEQDMELLTSLASVAALRIRNLELAEEAARRRHLEEELALARRIQVALVPSQLPRLPGWEIHTGNRPSRGVSGDFYLAVERPAGDCVLMVADVSGKGIAASLLGAALEALTAGPMEEGRSPAEIFSRVNDLLHRRSPPERFATVFLAALDPGSGELTYASAGHDPALVLRLDGETELLHSTGVPVGLLTGSVFQEKTIRVDAGDLLAIYTDGLTEAAAPGGEEYGLPRLTDVLRGHRDRDLGVLAADLDRDMEAFVDGEPFHDDRTLFLLRRS